MRCVSIALIVIVTIMAGALGKEEKQYYDLADAAKHFEAFKAEYKRHYNDEADEKVHFEAFKSNLAKINELNEKSPHTTFGINKLADYTEEERKKMFGLRIQ